jgi:hypothetical protein
MEELEQLIKELYDGKLTEEEFEIRRLKLQ